LVDSFFILFYNHSELPLVTTCIITCIVILSLIIDNSPSIVVNDTQLKEVDHQKHLGIIFDKQLCWDNQVNYVCKRIAYYLHLPSIHWNSLTYSILKLLSESLIFSRITYALPVWGPPLRKDQISHL